MSGERCRLLGNYRVQHFDCDEYPDGTITDIRDYPEPPTDPAIENECEGCS